LKIHYIEYHLVFISNDRSSIEPYIHLTLRDESSKLESFFMIGIRCPDLDRSLGHSYGFSLIRKINIRRDRHSQVLKGVN
jgi:hypothetical protein